ncbi:MAG: hypothetical protein IPJ18_06150 [Betaproteobacteria bacterium]|nr:hypothetical protein [Betaproteobacteria bacterium]
MQDATGANSQSDASITGQDAKAPTMANVTSLSDIAGQLTEASHNADQVTVAGVCLPTGALSQLRRRIPSGFPKWRNATDKHVLHLVSLMCEESLGIVAYSIDKREPWWVNFWKDASHVHSKAANLSGASIGILKAGTLLKFLLFGESATLSLAHSIRSGALPPIRSRGGTLHISHALVFDSDLQGAENIDSFADTWRASNANRPLTASLGIEYKATTMQITTEQEEPLLLMPDYIAGLIHAKNSDSDTLKFSHVTASAVTSALALVTKSGRFVEFDAPSAITYTDIYPDFANLLPQSAPSPVGLA